MNFKSNRFLSMKLFCQALVALLFSSSIQPNYCLVKKLYNPIQSRATSMLHQVSFLAFISCACYYLEKPLGVAMYQSNSEQAFFSVFIVRNHVKLMDVINSHRVFSKGTVLCGRYQIWLGRSLGHCRPALPKGRKYQMVKTQTQSHDRRPVV